MRAISLFGFFAPNRCCEFLWMVLAGMLGFVLPRVIFAAPGVIVKSLETGRFTSGDESSQRSIAFPTVLRKVGLLTGLL